MNFTSLFAALGKALPGYVDGERAAIKDNWQDLTNYNQVHKGQLENAWTEATWKPALNNAYMGMWGNALDFYGKAQNASLDARDFTRKLDRQDFLYKNQDEINQKTLENLLRPGAGGQLPQQIPGTVPPTLPTLDSSNNDGVAGMQKTK